jgi:hypothetical protein
MQARLHTPRNLGDPFIFKVDRCVNFSDENDRVAIAIYLNTLRIGLELGLDIDGRSNDISDPKSLCCWNPPQTLHLLASPIPQARQTT